jgi:nucleotide-binding universal stress UspA family protein
MALTDRDAQAVPTLTHPVLFAYDGSELAALAIEQAGHQYTDGRDGLVLCVWQPADVGFTPTSKRHFDADSASEVGKAADETAAYGASLATQAGFHAQSLAFEGSPIWKGIIDAAADHDASVIVIGSHRRSGLRGHLLGSVAAQVAAHAQIPVMLVSQPA